MTATARGGPSTAVDGADDAAIVGGLRAAHDELRGSGPAPGRAWCRAWTAEVDDAVTALAGPAVGGHRLAVAATGGYGRRELCPASDVDLLVVHDGLGDRRLETVVRELIYPLWDAGLAVGYAVRTPGECREAAAEVDTATAVLDARPVAGDAQLVRTAVDGVVERLRAEPGAFLDALSRADADRRARAGDAAEVLEPDLKRGAGGLRDVQSLRWAAAAVVGTTGLDPLVSARYLGAPDRTRLARAYDQLLGIRVGLHLHADRERDVLELAAQGPVAARLGYRDGATDRDTAAHRLLSDHFLAARTVDHVHQRAWRLLSADATRGRRRMTRSPEMIVNSLEIVDGVARLPAGQPAADRRLPARLAEVLSRHEVVLDRRTAGHIRRYVADGGSWEWDDATRLAFLRMLWRGREALPAVAELDDVGLLGAMLPEWEPVRGRAQRNPYHRFAVDRHGWHAAAELSELVRREPWAATALEAVGDRDALMLGTWLHDVGKAYGEPHSETGVEIARSVAARMGAPPDTVDRVGRMVALHLLLPDTAERRDLTDEREIRRVAGKVGDDEMLTILHLLTAADGLATGPGAWSDWRASLVGRLVRRVRAVLEGDQPGELAGGPSATAAEAQRTAAGDGVDPARVRAHLAQLPRRYAASVPAGTVVRHAGAADEVAAAADPAPLRLEVSSLEVPTAEPVAGGADGPGVRVIDVVAPDQAGLLARIAGVLALHGLDVTSASAFTRDDGIATDHLTVRASDGAGRDPDGEPWTRLRDDLDDAIAGRLALRQALERKRELDERGRAPTADVDTDVRLTPDRRGAATVVEVSTADRRGVLFDILATVEDEGFDVALAKVQTLGPRVHDTFYVRTRAGERLDDQQSDRLRNALTAALRG